MKSCYMDKCYWCDKAYNKDMLTREHIVLEAWKSREEYQKLYKAAGNVVKACESCNRSRGSIYGVAIFDLRYKVCRRQFHRFAMRGVFKEYAYWIELEKQKLGFSYLERETSQLFKEIYFYLDHLTA